MKQKHRIPTVAGDAGVSPAARATARGTIEATWAVIAPGIVFQSVITGGGFATGREASQYFAQFGPSSFGLVLLVGMLFAMLSFLTIELARKFRAYDYGTWSRELLGRMAWLVDLLFVVMAVIVCAVALSGGAVVLREAAHISLTWGIVLGLVVTAAIVSLGRAAVLFTKIIGAAILTTTYVLCAGAALAAVEWSGIVKGMPSQPFGMTWTRSVIEYVCYNTVALPACLYAMRGIKSTRESAAAGVIMGLLWAVPMMLILLCVFAAGDEATRAAAPLHTALLAFGGAALLACYYGVLGWTLFDTAVGMIFAVIGRCERRRGHARPWIHVLVWRIPITVVFFGMAIAVAQEGIAKLVEDWYGTIAYAFMIVIVVPLATRGVWKLVHGTAPAAADAETSDIGGSGSLVPGPRGVDAAG